MLVARNLTQTSDTSLGPNWPSLSRFSYSATVEANIGSASSQYNIGLTWNDDGTRLYYGATRFNNGIIRYNNTGFTKGYYPEDVVYANTTDVASDPRYASCDFKDDGTEMYIADYESANLDSYDVTGDAFNPDSPSELSAITSKDLSGESPISVDFKNDGTKFWIIAQNSGPVWRIVEYDLSTAWDISTATKGTVLTSTELTDVDPGQFRLCCMRVSPHGDRFWVSARDSYIYEYDLSTPYDISTYSYSSNKLDVSGVVSDDSIGPAGFALPDNGEYLSVNHQSATVANQEISIWSGAYDPYYEDVLLLLKFEGTDGAITTTDSSSYTHTVNRVFGANATTVDIDTSEKKFDKASTFILNSASTDGGGWQVPTGQAALDIDDNADWTIEFWINVVATTDSAVQHVFDTQAGANTGVMMYFQSANFGAQVNGLFFNKANSVVAGTWQHVALCRDGTSVYMYVDGVWTETETIGTANVVHDNTTTVNIGNRDGGTDGIQGSGAYIDELRWTHGVARYPGGVNFDTTPTIARPSAFPTWKSPQG